jgi:5'-nucleotidase/UDP-sugar diphosphatase
MGEVLTVLPFQNTIATFGLTGADILAALENGLSKVEEGAGRFPQVGGMRYVWDPSAPAGSRVVSVETGGDAEWVPLDPERVYSVVSNNFMRAGGDGYSVFRDSGIDAYDYGPGLEEATAAYIAAHSPYEPRVQGRVEIVQNQ